MSTEKLAPYVELVGVLDNLGLLVREARRSRGLSLRSAATEAGLSFNTLARIERGEDFRMSNGTAVLRWLDQTWRKASS